MEIGSNPTGTRIGLFFFYTNPNGDGTLTRGGGRVYGGIGGIDLVVVAAARCLAVDWIWLGDAEKMVG